ncbi:hypothetical protein QKC54_gp0159 [Megavirus baoshan]|uniref:Nudix hydrolase domain-containing protein n=1 Tax=Megavirus baoshan TaxID=2496520 RepID=A0A8K1T122_9VIRU|nr:hypothetical protein QKC54_gp0159 [Megavirus baoshan]UFX99893.1 hypothetical protein Mb0913 [Megavirus baoshan]
MKNKNTNIIIIEIIYIQDLIIMSNSIPKTYSEVVNLHNSLPIPTRNSLQIDSRRQNPPTPIFTRSHSCDNAEINNRFRNHGIPRRCGIALIDCNDYVLIVRQNNDCKKWGFPKGHMEEIDHGSMVQCAVREFYEEVGLSTRELNCCILQQCQQQFLCGNMDNEMTIYVLKTTKCHKEIQVKLSNELSEFEWINYDTLMASKYSRNYEFNMSINIVLSQFVRITNTSIK